jgi:hypothetical protein
MRTSYKVIAAVFVMVLAAPLVYNLFNHGWPFEPSFSDTEIANVEQSIRSEFGKREGITVTEVRMMKESPRKLSGLAKIQVPEFGEVTKSCSATMGEDAQYIWECK